MHDEAGISIRSEKHFFLRNYKIGSCRITVPMEPTAKVHMIRVNARQSDADVAGANREKSGQSVRKTEDHLQEAVGSPHNKGARVAPDPFAVCAAGIISLR